MPSVTDQIPSSRSALMARLLSVVSDDNLVEGRLRN